MNITQINIYKKYIEGGEYSNISLEKLSDRYSQQVSESISHLDVIINSTRANTIYRDSIPYKCIVDYGRLPKEAGNSLSMLYRELWTKHSDGIMAGDVIQFAHNPYADSERKIYLLIKRIETREGYDMSIMQPCLTSLVWLDFTGTKREAYFCPKVDTASNFGIQDGRILAIGNERRQIYIQSNLYTQEIHKDNRFIFDGRVWRVSVVDRLQENIITLTLDEDEIDTAKDNLDLRIADYTNNIANYTLEIVNGTSLSMETEQSIQLETLIKNNGTVVTPNVIYTSSDEDIATVSSSGLITSVSLGNAVITASLELDDNVTDTISVTVEDVVVDSYTVEITSASTSPNEIKKNLSKTYIGQSRNNGAPIEEELIFEVFADNKIDSTTLAIITVQDGTNCTVKNNASNSGYVQLKVSLISDVSVVNWIRIQMKPIY